jgi:YesN/AraC family two-component response regulator
LKVLIIDDEPLIRRSLQRAFQAKKHVVFEAEEGRLGIDIWLKEEPDLVILDILMPVMSGPEVLKKISGQHRAKVILISAYSGDYNIEKIRQMGADLFIKKPFDNVFDVVTQAETLAL